LHNFSRVLPFVWPSRKKLFLSFFFAALVAILWGGNLSIAFPVVKVLFDERGIAGYISDQIQANEAEIRREQRSLAEFAERLKWADREEAVSLTRKKQRSEGRIASALKRVAALKWIDVFLLPNLPRDRFWVFALIMGLLLVMTLLKLVCMFAEEVLVGSVVSLTVMRIRKQCFRKVLGLDYQTLRMQGNAELMSRFTYDMEALGSGLALLGGKIVREPLKAAACLTFAMWINWRLTLLSILFVPLAAVVFHRIGRALKKASHRSMESMSRIYKVLEETLESLKVVIAFHGGRRHRIHHHHESKTFYEKSMRIVVVDALTSPVTELMGIAAVVVAMLPGAYLVLRGRTELWGIPLASGKMDIAELSVMYAMLAGVADPIRKLSSIFSKLKRSSAAADRIFQLMECQPLVGDPVLPQSLPREVRTLEFQEVGFTYATKGHARPTVLDGISLQVNSGEVIALVGENGSGKSTLVNLLPPFFDPDRGAVLIDGIDIRDCLLQDLRGRIGMVTQETLLFDDTIFENIRYGRPDATREEVELAAKTAHVCEFLDLLPEGFDTRVGERGASLSGGQRQRIALARAILRNPSVFILDEATNAVDAQSEALIHATLETFVRGRTTFIVTHSLAPSLLKLVSRVVVLQRGRLLSCGTHEELLKTCPVYQRLYHHRGQPAEAKPAWDERPAA
jgi:ATP-binding cassette, subfamily B, bacterial MsbA